jgi:hypothetical protein
MAITYHCSVCAGETFSASIIPEAVHQGYYTPMRVFWLAAVLSGLLCSSLTQAGEQLENLQQLVCCAQQLFT